LLEAVLDLHGLALARIMSAVASAKDGKELLAGFAEDEQIKAVLLLYGLHPEDPETRLHRALAGLQPRFDQAGIVVKLGRVTAKAASLRVSGDPLAAERLPQEIEQAIVNAAPDLDEIAVDWHDASDVQDDAEARVAVG
jgi:hypothetical protein